MALFMGKTSELPDISKHKTAKAYWKGLKAEFFGEMMTSGNSEVAILTTFEETVIIVRADDVSKSGSYVHVAFL